MSESPQPLRPEDVTDISMPQEGGKETVGAMIVRIGRKQKMLGENQKWNNDLTTKGLQHWVDEIKLETGEDVLPEQVQAALDELAQAA